MDQPLQHSLLLCAIFAASIAFDRGSKLSRPWAAVVFLIIVAYVTFRDGENMPDYPMYSALYQQVLNLNFTYFIEPTFSLLAKVSALVTPTSAIGLFALYAIISVGIKITIVRQLAIPFFGALSIYASNTLILHDMIQIRAGAAASLLIASVYFSSRGMRLKAFTAWVLATTFHFSFFIFLFVLLLKKRFVSAWTWALLAPIALLSYLVVDKWALDAAASLLAGTPLGAKTATYGITDDPDLRVNPFGAISVLHWLIFYFALCFRRLLSQKDPIAILTIKAYGLSCFLYSAIAIFPYQAVRFSQALLSFEIILIPLLASLIKNRLLRLFVIGLYSVIIFILNLLFTNYFIGTS